MGSIPGLGKSPGEGNGNPFQHSCLGNPTDSRAWQATVHGSQRVRHSLATKQQKSGCEGHNQLESLFFFFLITDGWIPTPEFLIQ